jgi:hypothetical protein
MLRAKTEAPPARWDLSVAIAQQTSASYEPDGRPIGEFVFHYSRTVFFSDIDTGDPSELAEDRTPG